MEEKGVSIVLVYPLSVESLTPRTSTYSTLRYELWKLERVYSTPPHRPIYLL
jgi:hypothetical protein